MSVNRTVSADKFAIALEEIFGGIDRALSDGLEEPVKAACKAAKKKASSADAGTPAFKNRTGVYRKSFSYKVDRKGRYEAYGYVGNRKKPGLVHLLEKGHATMRGGRTRAFPHMEPGAREGERVLLEESGKLVDGALR